MGRGAKLSKETAPQVGGMPGFEGRYQTEDGYIFGFESFAEAGDSFAPAKTPNGAAKPMSAAQIAAKYGSSVVRITTPPMPPSATGKKKPSPIVGSGFMATKDGLIVTSLAVVQGKGMTVPFTVTVEYTLPTGEYGRATGTVLGHSEQTGIAEIKVDPQKVPLTPLLLGDSDSIAAGEPVAALAIKAT